MPVYHIVLFKLKKSAGPDIVDEFKKRAKAMPEKVPGLLKLDIDSPIAATASRARGYDMGIVAVLENPEDIPVYMTHPAHLYAQELRLQLCEDDPIAFDMEFSG